MEELLNSSPESADLYQLMLQNVTNENGSDVFTQKELVNLSEISDPKELMTRVQILMDRQMVQAVTQNGELAFRVISLDMAARKGRMGGDELMVYTTIESSGREGIWTKSIKDRTGLHQTVISRCLKSLESKKDIKAIKSVKHPTRKIYMLFNLQPSTDVTGGPWFTDSELDSEFINSLLMIVWKFVTRESFPIAFEDTDKLQESYPVTYRGYPTVKKIHQFVMTCGVINEGTDLGEADVRKLCEVLVFDDKLERRDGGYTYRSTWQSVVEAGGGPRTIEVKSNDAFNESACGQCPVFNLCAENGPVNPDECKYYDEWLDPAVRVANQIEQG